MFEGTAHDSKEYAANIARVGKLVKSGGTILIYGLENPLGYYMVGDFKFPNVHVTAESGVQVDKLFPSKDKDRVFRFIKASLPVTVLMYK